MSLSAAVGVISGFNECVTLWQWAKSAISSLHTRWTGSQQQDFQGRVLEVESGLQRLRDTLPAMHDLINKAEWKCKDDVVAALLPNLKDAVYETKDLLDEFSWYEKRVQVEGDASQSPFIDFFATIIQGSFNKLNDVQSRLNHLSSQLDNMGLRGITQRFDKLVRPETTSLPNETKIFGRDKELEQVLGYLNVPKKSKRKRAICSNNASASTSTSSHVINESGISSLPILPIVGIGGVGKTTLAQIICSHQRVRSHFDLIIWICVSDDFDVKRLTKEVIRSCTRKEGNNDNLDSLQRALSNHVNNKRLLIVLDDMWDDALKENGQCWKRFCAPFGSVQEGSMMLVTTRGSKVSEGVRTLEPFVLEGLKGELFWNFFKLCAFGSKSSNNDPELESIGRRILPKLKGSPLAAKTLGRMLSMNLEASNWKFILDSELWSLPQEETDILPALRLSYMYLPLYLKQCFAFCAVYPKDYKFQKTCLAEIWVAEGLVEPQGDVPIQDIGCQYFQELVARSFFQKVSGRYVIHDLLHDMAQKVSEHDCFILRNKSHFDKVPRNVRHLYVNPNSDFNDSNLLRLCTYTKLRTIICKKNLGKKTSLVMDNWCTKLPRIRLISCVSTDELPDSIGNWKHLRYLEITRACPLKRIPSTFCWLYNLQTLYAKKCKLESLPCDFGKLISLQKFESHGLSYYAGGSMTLDSANMEGHGIRLIKNLNQFRGCLKINNVSILSKERAADIELKSKKYLERLELDVHSLGALGNGIEMLEVLQPPISLKSLSLENYAGVSLTTWFQPQNLPDITSLHFGGCVGLKSICISPPMLSQSTSLNDILAISTFMSLTNVSIKGCTNISSLEDFLHPDYVPAIERIRIDDCRMLESIPTEKFGDFHFLEELQILHCPKIRIQRLVSPSLKKLSMWGSSHFSNIDCCSLIFFDLACPFDTSIELEMWCLPSLQKLQFRYLSLTSIRCSIVALSSLNVLTVTHCPKLSTLDALLTHELLPAIEKIEVQSCRVLLSLPVERFVSFPFLKHLEVCDCPSLSWPRGVVLPSYLESLCLKKCGDVSPFFPSCLQNLTSLVTLDIAGLGITLIPGDIWQSNLASLEKLRISGCPDLVSIGGTKAVAKIKMVWISECPKLQGAERISRRLSRRDQLWWVLEDQRTT